MRILKIVYAGGRAVDEFAYGNDERAQADFDQLRAVDADGKSMIIGEKAGFVLELYERTVILWEIVGVQLIDPEKHREVMTTQAAFRHQTKRHIEGLLGAIDRTTTPKPVHHVVANSPRPPLADALRAAQDRARTQEIIKQSIEAEAAKAILEEESAS